MYTNRVQYKVICPFGCRADSPTGYKTKVLVHLDMGPTHLQDVRQNVSVQLGMELTHIIIGYKTKVLVHLDIGLTHLQDTRQNVLVQLGMELTHIYRVQDKGICSFGYGADIRTHAGYKIAKP